MNIINEREGALFLTALTLIENMAARNEIDTLVIASRKPNSFIVGADVEFQYLLTDAEKAKEESNKFKELLQRLEDLPVTTIAMLNGMTLGGGLEIALACNYRVADAACSQIGLPEVKIGGLSIFTSNALISSTYLCIAFVLPFFSFRRLLFLHLQMFDFVILFSFSLPSQA